MPKIKRKKRHLKQKVKSIHRKYAPVVAAKKLIYHCKATAITTPSGLTYKIVEKAGINR
jgi:hypothetical protein